ncbi:MAG: hypothetical protein HYT79_03145 [Elusimicrobia bacterium]|nr:hypothetical protein [Elusimicrobiota bacterium]
MLETLFLNRPVDYRSGSGHPAYVRMAKLLRYEYVRRTRVPDFGQVFTLTPRGHYWLKSKGSAIFFGLPPAWPREGKLRHSLLVASTGLWFSRWLKLEAVAERELIAGLRSPEKAKAKGFFLRTPLPDLLIKLNGRWTRVEVELSEKSKQRYLRMWEKLKPPSGQPHHWIIYICGDLKLKERLLDCAREVFVPGIHAISISHITNFNDIYGVGIGTQVGR